ncbi:MAG: MoxR family ATPase [Ruminococcus sp.]|nr:MoxR family ATPase [Ruminococcus sp.]
MNPKIKQLSDSIGKVIVGKEDTVIKVICAMISGGHILIEDVPGVGKTQFVSALAKSVNGKFNRVQLTPDVMPSDIVGYSFVDKNTFELEYRQGIAFCNFLLADEINRASPKVQSGLLEAMEEFSVTVDGVTHALPQPFMVLATQNPVETSGTYRLPEAQMDRFFMRVSMGYPNTAEEMQILKRTEAGNPIHNIENSEITLEDVKTLKQEAIKIKVTDSVKEYIIKLSEATRQTDDVTLGVSPRGSIALFKAAKARALVYEREFVTPDDVKLLAESVLSHRIILSGNGKNKFKSGNEYIRNLITEFAVPL